MNTPLFLLRVIQVGLTLADLDDLEAGTVFDILTESSNDNEKYKAVAEQSDFDRF